MKFIFGLILFSVLCCSPLNAQFTLGIRLGTSSNVVHLTGNTLIDVSPRLNGLPGMMGLAPGIRLSDRWGFETGLQYIVKGYDDNTVEAPPLSAFGNKATGFRFHYAEFCPQLIFRWKPEFTLQAGGYAGYLFKKERRSPGFSRWDSLPDTFDGFFSDMDAGLSAGFSVYYRRVSFFVQFQAGLLPIASFYFSNGSSKTSVRMYNRTFMLGVGYALLD